MELVHLIGWGVISELWKAEHGTDLGRQLGNYVLAVLNLRCLMKLDWQRLLTFVHLILPLKGHPVIRNSRKRWAPGGGENNRQR